MAERHNKLTRQVADRMFAKFTEQHDDMSGSLTMFGFNYDELYRVPPANAVSMETVGSVMGLLFKNHDTIGMGFASVTLTLEGTRDDYDALRKKMRRTNFDSVPDKQVTAIMLLGPELYAYSRRFVMDGDEVVFDDEVVEEHNKSVPLNLPVWPFEIRSSDMPRSLMNKLTNEIEEKFITTEKLDG